MLKCCAFNCANVLRARRVADRIGMAVINEHRCEATRYRRIYSLDTIERTVQENCTKLIISSKSGRSVISEHHFPGIRLVC